MTLHLHTNTPEYANDLGDVIRLMLPGSVVSLDGEDRLPRVRHQHVEGPLFWEETCVLEDHQGRWEQRWSVPKVCGNPLLEKRLRKRAVKQCCYYLFRQREAAPPWGSLTGIRPTRLYYEALREGRQEASATAWLQGMFDLRADKATLLREIVQAQKPFMGTDEDAVDLYVGIPYCVTRCAYCSFASEIPRDQGIVELYLLGLHKEIQAISALMHETRLRPRALYIGGGTPTALTASQLDDLLSLLANLFPKLAEWTVEAGRPDTMDRPRLEAIRRHPVTRISVNPQTMEDSTLRRIGRNHTAQDILDAFGLARSLGFDNINMDLIAALPGENCVDFARTLEAVAALDPEAITIHTLARKRASKLSEDPGFHPGDSSQAEQMVDLGRAKAQELGMVPYYLYRQKHMAGNLENVGYAKPQAICRYNIDIMEETTSILALGTGAISKRVFPGEGRIERAPNMMDTARYLERLDEMIQRKRALWKDRL